MISPTDIRYFVEVAASGNLSRAAERLGLSQPALTYSLNRIEKEMAAKLLERGKKGVALTSAGKLFLSQAKELAEQWSMLKQSIHQDRDLPKGRIRLGCHSAVAQYSLPKFLPIFLTEFPLIQLELRHGLSRLMTAEVIGGGLDVALAVNPVAHPDLVIRELCKDTVTLWAARKNKNPKVLIVEPSLLQSQDIIRKLAKKNHVFDRVVESSSLEVIAQLMSAGAGVAILPTRVVEAISSKDVLRVSGAPEFQDRICLVARPEFLKSKRGQVFFESVIRSFR